MKQQKTGNLGAFILPPLSAVSALKASSERQKYLRVILVIIVITSAEASSLRSLEDDRTIRRAKKRFPRGSGQGLRGREMQCL